MYEAWVAMTKYKKRYLVLVVPGHHHLSSSILNTS